MRANKVERIEISVSSNRSHGALAISQTSTKPKKDCSPAGNYKCEERYVSPRNIANV
jgi:hypothetical protein